MEGGAGRDGYGAQGFWVRILTPGLCLLEVRCSRLLLETPVTNKRP